MGNSGGSAAAAPGCAVRSALRVVFWLMLPECPRDAAGTSLRLLTLNAAQIFLIESWRPGFDKASADRDRTPVSVPNSYRLCGTSRDALSRDVLRGELSNVLMVPRDTSVPADSHEGMP
ncbi:hypothetical protein GCM10010411_39010 [Actinomadura fulvescens]|uniref:Uncharacterized protein n=1 Tax=Actinomadura fulvescens TaxID=46160 RepID=A0ABP6C409_9ACTN